MEKFHLEYIFGKASPSILWNSISTSHGLESWFADAVAVSTDAQGNEVFSFSWDGRQAEQAVLKQSRVGVYVRFHWLDSTDLKSFFELRISKNELTCDLVLSVTDFSFADERQDSIKLWNQQIDDLHAAIGA